MLYPLPPRKNGFKKIKDVMENINVHAEDHGWNCMNPGHQGSVSNLKMVTHFCDTCHCSGQPTTKLKKSTLPKLIPIISTGPIFMVVLVSRSSSGKKYHRRYYNLRQTIVTKKR
jgi:hypothetical protein